MSRGPRIPKIKFLAVVADIKKHPTTTFGVIANRHKISNTSVANINRARTWSNYLAHKAATVSVRNAAKSAPKVQRAKAAGLKPITAEQRRIIQGNAAKFRQQRQERELQQGLDRLVVDGAGAGLQVQSKRGMSINVADELDSHNDRLGAQLDLIRAARKEAAKADRLSKIATCMSIAALILALVK